MRRKAFQILFAKAFPWLHNSSSNKISLPAEADNNNPQRTPFAPNFSIKSNGSGELPTDLDIFLPCVSRTIPVKYTLENGFSPAYSYPAIIIRATQKNKISGPVTKSLVG